MASSLEGILYEYTQGGWLSRGRKRKRRIVLCGTRLETHPISVKGAEADGPAVYDLTDAKIACSGSHLTLTGPQLPRSGLELGVQTDALLAQWVAAIARQIALAHQASVHGPRKSPPSERIDPEDSPTAPIARTATLPVGDVKSVRHEDPTSRRASTGTAVSLQGSMPGATMSPLHLPLAGGSSPPLLPKVFPGKGLGRAGAVGGGVARVLASDAAADVVEVMKQPDEPMGLVWEDHTRLASVVQGSPADRGRLQVYHGWRVTHANGKEVKSLRNLRAAATNCDRVILRMVPPQRAAPRFPPQLPKHPGPPTSVTITVPECEAMEDVSFTTAKGGEVRVAPAEKQEEGKPPALHVWYNGELDPPCSDISIEIEPGKVELVLGDPSMPFRLDEGTCASVLGELKALARAAGVTEHIPDSFELPLPPVSRTSSFQSSSVKSDQWKHSSFRSSVVASLSLNALAAPAATSTKSSTTPLSPPADTATTDDSPRTGSPGSRIGGSPGPVLVRRLGRGAVSPVRVAAGSPRGHAQRAAADDISSPVFDLSTIGLSTESRPMENAENAEPQDLTTWAGLETESPTMTEMTDTMTPFHHSARARGLPKACSPIGSEASPAASERKP